MSGISPSDPIPCWRKCLKFSFAPSSNWYPSGYSRVLLVNVGGPSGNQTLRHPPSPAGFMQGSLSTYSTLWPCQVSNFRSPTLPGPKVALAGAPLLDVIKWGALLEGPSLTTGMDCGANPVDVGGAEGFPNIPVVAGAVDLPNAGAGVGTD